MKQWQRWLILAGTVLAFLSAGRVYAQEATPPASPQTVTVEGRIVNGTPGGEVPPSLTVMIHAWDESNQEVLARTATSTEGGRFRFEGIPVDATWTYAVMAMYQDVAYFAPSFSLAGNVQPPEVEVPIYEITTDSSGVVIERLHLFFDVTTDGVNVTEVYILSNRGDRTVFGAVTLEDGSRATLIFPLPSNASAVRFDQTVEGEFVRQPGGFADTMPLVPGESVRQVLVSYLLPYTPNMTYRHTVRYPIAGITALVPTAQGISLQSQGLVLAGQQTTSDGLSIDVYTHEGIEPGQEINITLKGTPNARVGNMVGRIDTAPSGRPWDVIVGGIVLGLTLIAVGAWWYRRPVAESVDEMEESTDQAFGAFDRVVSQIAALDDAHARGELSERAYRERRRRLFQQARGLLIRHPDVLASLDGFASDILVEGESGS